MRTTLTLLIAAGLAVSMAACSGGGAGPSGGFAVLQFEQAGKDSIERNKALVFVFSEPVDPEQHFPERLKIQNIQVFTHDSIGLGEDGPTHQPVEQVATLRMMPNMTVWRPCDAVESAVAWKAAVKNTSGPTSLIFSRQNLDH